MARFRGTIRGARGEASRLGHSNLEGRVAGWNVGVSLFAYRDENDNDSIGIRADEGNGANAGRSFSLGTVLESADGPIWLPSEFAVAQVIADNRAGKYIHADLEDGTCPECSDSGNPCKRCFQEPDLEPDYCAYCTDGVDEPPYCGNEGCKP